MKPLNYTPEPWIREGISVIRGNPQPTSSASIPPRSELVAIIQPNHPDREAGNMARIISCVNGCKGIADPATTVPEMVRAFYAYYNNPGSRAAEKAALKVFGKVAGVS